MRTVRAFIMGALSDRAVIDLAKVDRRSFKLVSRGDRVLIHPDARKRAWTEDELHLRSCVTDAQGRVLSLGFPKFFNLGEHAPHDARFAAAIADGRVAFGEKVDGSLLVADIEPDGALSLRTRQSHALSDLREPVEALVRARYPALRDALAGCALVREGCSALFEFVDPARPVVLRYPEAALVLLALVDKRSLAPRWDEAALAQIAADSGVARATAVTLPHETGALREAVRPWLDREGVVAHALDRDGRPLMLKVKADSYLRLHAARGVLGTSNAPRIAFLLDAESEDDFVRQLEARGVDFETVEYARSSLGDYFARLSTMREGLAKMQSELGAMTQSTRAGKHAFVERARAYIEAHRDVYADSTWFNVAVRVGEGRLDDARVIAYATLLGQSAPTVRQWFAQRSKELDALFAPRRREEE